MPLHSVKIRYSNTFWEANSRNKRAHLPASSFQGYLGYLWMISVYFNFMFPRKTGLPIPRPHFFVHCFVPPAKPRDPWRGLAWCIQEWRWWKFSQETASRSLILSSWQKKNANENRRVSKYERGFPTKKHHWTHIWNDYSKWRYIIHKWKKMFLKNFSRRFSTHIAALLSKKAQQTLNQPIRQNEDKHNFWSRAINNIYVESAKNSLFP